MNAGQTRAKMEALAKMEKMVTGSQFYLQYLVYNLGMTFVINLHVTGAVVPLATKEITAN